MNGIIRKSLSTAILIGAALPLTAAPIYTLSLLNPSGPPTSTGFSSHASAINNVGQVTGTSWNGSVNEAFIWDGITVQILNSSFRFGYGINDLGHVVGTDGQRTFIWNGVSTLDIGTLGGVFARGLGINNLGQATGYSGLSNFNSSSAFFWDGTTLQDLGTLGGSSSIATAINQSGHVTGGASTTGDTAERAFFWNGTSLQDLGTLGGSSSRGNAINNAGHVAGDSRVNGAERAFLWNGTSMRDLGALGLSYSTARAINNAGHVVGQAGGSTTSVGFFWDGTTMWDLNSLIQNNPGWQIIDATGINDLGQISGRAFKDGRIQAFLLTPASVSVPEPRAWDMMAVGGLGILALARRKRC